MKFPDIFAAVHKTNLQLQLHLQFPASDSSFGSNEVMSYFYNSNILIIRGEAKAKARQRQRQRQGQGQGARARARAAANDLFVICTGKASV